MGTAVTRPGDWIGELFPDRPTADQLNDCYYMWWRVVLSHLPPRHERFEYDCDFGMGQVEAALTHRELRFDKVVNAEDPKRRGQLITFMFPERWMTTQEEYYFVPMLQQHPQVLDAGLTIVDMCTKSPLIVGNFRRDDVRIMKGFEGDRDGWDMGLCRATRDVDAKSKAAYDAWRKAREDRRREAESAEKAGAHVAQ